MNMQNQNKGEFPSDTLKNPKDCMEIQLRSGKEVSSSNSRKEKKEKVDEEEEETRRGEEQPEKSCELKQKEKVQAYAPAMLFPQRLQKAREARFSNFLEIFKKI